MKHLFSARHGDYNPSDDKQELTDEGRYQMQRLAGAIKEILNGGSSYLITSSAPRAINCGKEMGNHLGISDLETDPYLWAGFDSPMDNFMFNPDYARLLGPVNKNRDRADGIIVISHKGVAENLARRFQIQEWGNSDIDVDIQKGHAVHIDLEGKGYGIIP